MNNSPLKLKVIIGSTREDRFSEFPAKWIVDHMKQLEGVDVEVLDLRDFPMPFFDSAQSPSYIKEPYPDPNVQKWTAKIADSDGYVMVAPEYNHGYSAVLKNAIDWVYKEWNNKAVGFVSYGSVGGGRGVEQMRLVAIELQMAPVRTAVHIPWPSMVAVREGKTEELENFKHQADTMLKQLVMWSKAMKSVRM